MGISTGEILVGIEGKGSNIESPEVEIGSIVEKVMGLEESFRVSSF